MPLPNPVVVVPGITATYLKDQYPVSPDAVWTVMTKDFERIVLHPEAVARGRAYEAVQPARVVADQVYEVAYKELIEELRHNLTPSFDRPVPVYAFGYDWRKKLEDPQRELAAFLEEVVERTSLLPHYRAEGYTPATGRVNLVGHSMGGLIVAGYLAAAGGSHRAGKVATLATPFRGSFEAVIKVATGTAALGGSAPSSREREAARLTPALYHLLPRFGDSLTVENPAFGSSMFDVGVWQPGVAATLRSFLVRCGVAEQDAGVRALEVLTLMLETARAHRDRVEAFRLENAGLTASDWLCVAGAGTETRVSMTISDRGGAPEFELSSEDRDEQFTKGRSAKARQRTGDGTVPLPAAVPAFLDAANVLCVCPADFGYWELQDTLMSKAAGFHGILPNMNMLHRLLVRHFSGRPAAHDSIWGTPYPGVAKTDWDPAVPKEDLKA